MYSVWEINLLGGVILIWLAFLSYQIWKDKKATNNLFPKSGERDIRGKFREVLEKVKDFESKQADFDGALKKFQLKNLANFQRTSLLRYNPYQDTGGDQSFSLVALDGYLDGFLITSLHSRSGTRVYLKKITKGKADLELSKEEKLVLHNALETPNG